MSSPAPSPRSFGPDAARACALILMTCTHTIRVASPHQHSDLSQWLMRLEPITPTLFALLVGAGLAASQTRRPASNWRSHHLVRGLALIALSWLIFLLYNGIQQPESITSTGILQCLGTGIVLVSLLGAPVATGIVGAVLFALWTWMESAGIRVDGLNKGSFPIFPYVPFLLFAHSWTRITHERESWRGMLSVGAVIVVVMMAISPGFRVAWGSWGITETYQTFDISLRGSNSWALLQDLASGTPTGFKRMSFWHTQPWLTPLMVAMASLFIIFFRTASIYIPSDTRYLSLLGRNSLTYYLAHFAGLGIITLLPSHIRHANWTWFVATASMALLGILYSIWREVRSRKAATP